MRTLTPWLLWVVLLSAVACEEHAAEPPLPPPKYEVAPAPPGALGARAAGTDAAPAPPEEELNPWPSEEEEELPPGHPPTTKPREGGVSPMPAPDAGGLPL